VNEGSTGTIFRASYENSEFIAERLSPVTRPLGALQIYNNPHDMTANKSPKYVSIPELLPTFNKAVAHSSKS
jgi:hypothetical protein